MAIHIFWILLWISCICYYTYHTIRKFSEFDKTGNKSYMILGFLGTMLITAQLFCLINRILTLINVINMK